MCFVLWSGNRDATLFNAAPFLPFQKPQILVSLASVEAKGESVHNSCCDSPMFLTKELVRSDTSTGA